MEVVYALSLGVIAAAALVAMVHPDIPTGIIGTSLVCMLGVCQLAAIERYGETPNWRVLMTICEAGLVVYAGVRWLSWRARR